MDFIRKHAVDNALLVLCGNKIDLPNRTVKLEEGKEYAKKNNLIYFEVSAKLNTNILEMLFFAVSKLSFFDSIPENEKADLVTKLISENADYETKKETETIGVVIRGQDETPKVVTPKEENKNIKNILPCCK